MHYLVDRRIVHREKPVEVAQIYKIPEGDEVEVIFLKQSKICHQYFLPGPISKGYDI